MVEALEMAARLTARRPLTRAAIVALVGALIEIFLLPDFAIFDALPFIIIGGAGFLALAGMQRPSAGQVLLATLLISVANSIPFLVHAHVRGASPVSILPFLPFAVLNPKRLLSGFVGAAVGWWWTRRASRPRPSEEETETGPRSLGRRKTRLLLVLGLLTLLGAGATAGWFAWYSSINVWPELRRTADRFEIGPGFMLVSRQEAGSQACVISCDEPRVIFRMRTSLPVSDACQALERAVADVGTQVMVPDNSDLPAEFRPLCDFEGKLPQIYENARIFADIEPDGTSVWVTFHSGI